MADRMKLAQLLAAAAALSAAGGSAAQALTDPTRPPAIENLGATGSATIGSLQSILLSSTRKGAIINGRYIPLGGAYGEAKLVRITASDVTLKSAQTTEVLKLYPSVEKTPAGSGVTRSKEASRR